MLSNVLVLSDGNVFARGSVVHIGPIDYWNEAFAVTGIGFSLVIKNPYISYLPNPAFNEANPFADMEEEEIRAIDPEAFRKLRQEYIDILMSPNGTKQVTGIP